MAVQRRVVTITPKTDLDRLLDEAVTEPVWLKRGSALFRLAKESSDVQSHANKRPSPFPERFEHESSVEFFDRLRAHIMRGRMFEDDSTELLRQSRLERTAGLP